jgi:hypothetical protein
MGGACYTYGTKEKYIHGFVRETARKETAWKNLGDEGMIKIKSQKRREGVDGIQLEQDSVQWRDLQKTVINLRVTYSVVNFLGI